MQKEKYIGIMSGTSLDGVDVVLCEIDTFDCKMLFSKEYPFPLALKSDILAILSKGTSLEQMGEIDHRLGLLFAKVVLDFLEGFAIKHQEIRAIGLHGQTLWHQPFGTTPFTMQWGDANMLTALTHIEVVADFRRKDVALGGQGAPFAPAFHQFLFGNSNEKVAIVNIGGMANISILDETLIGYDTGCGNVLLDLWIDKHLSKPYDKSGEWARGGTLQSKLLDAFFMDNYFKEAYPKSTGREKFNMKWLNFFNLNNYNPQNVQRTLLELTAQSIANEVQKFQRDKILLCGGGAKNSFLHQRIIELLPLCRVETAPYADEMEAMTFAWLAYKRIHKEFINLKEVTGARENSILGAVYV